MEATELQPDVPMALVLFTRQLATMIDAGFTLDDTLSVLTLDVPEPYGAAADALLSRIRNGYPLSDAMQELSTLFPNYYRQFVRCGEVGGVMEQACNFLADFLEEAWRWWTIGGRDARWNWLFADARPQPEDWADLGTDERTFIVMCFCRAVAMLEAAGVPQFDLFRTAAHLLPSRQRQQLIASVEYHPSYFLSARMNGLNVLPKMVHRLIGQAQQYVKLEAVMERATKYYRHQLINQLIGQASSTAKGI